MNGAFCGGRLVPSRARRLAAELVSLCEQDRQLGLHPDALALLYENTDRSSIPRRTSLVAGVMIDAIRSGGDEPDVEAAILAVLQERHWIIHRAFVQYGAVCYGRRAPAVRVGELGQQLADVLTAAGWPPRAVRGVNVHELGAGAS